MKGKYYVMPNFIDNTARKRLSDAGYPALKDDWFAMDETSIFEHNVPFDAVDWDCPIV